MVRKVKLKFKTSLKIFKVIKSYKFQMFTVEVFQSSKITKTIDLINEQDADVVLFTGDMVNNYADEFKPFIPLLKALKPKMENFLF